MSRRSNVSDSFYGQIKMKCPYKHELGAALRLSPGHANQHEPLLAA